MEKRKLTGYSIREAISQAEFDRDALRSEFADSQFAFRGETKRDPEHIMIEYESAEIRIAKLQTVQAMYNLQVEVTVDDETMSLAEAVKRIPLPKRRTCPRGKSRARRSRR